MRSSWASLALVGLSACLRPEVLELDPQLFEGAQAAVWSWRDPAPTYVVTAPSVDRVPLDLPGGSFQAELSLYRCAPVELGFEPGLHPWSSDCLPPTPRRIPLSTRPILGEEPRRRTLDCGPCALGPTRLVAQLDLEASEDTAVGLTLSERDVLISTFPSGEVRGGLYRVDVERRTVTHLVAPRGVPRTYGNLTTDGARIYGIDEGRLFLLAVSDDHFEATPLTATSTIEGSWTAGTLLIEGSRAYWATGFGGLYRTDFDPTGRESTARWVVIEPQRDPVAVAPYDGDLALHTGLLRRGRDLVGFGIAGDTAAYRRPPDGEPLLDVYALIPEDGRPELRPVEGGVPIDLFRFQARDYLATKSGRALEVLTDGRLDQPLALDHFGAQPRRVVGLADRIVYTSVDGTLVPVFWDRSEACEAIPLFFGGILLAVGHRVVQATENAINILEAQAVPDCGLPELGP